MPSKRTPRRPRTIAVTAVSVLVALGFAAFVAVPAAKDWYQNRHDEAASYRSGKEAKGDRVSVPRWLPDEARRIEYAMKTTGGDRLIKAALPSRAFPAGCKPHKPDTTPRPPAIRSTWFPKNAEQRAQARCGLYYAYMEGNTLYAWQANDDWAAERGV
ncbi:hypothetical protein AB0M94_12190 [Streptomyces xanthochromogenes]|uniref:Secreted protein n=1 Tax=Streptomyces xanthochromogenes TaxID=67384 RepID=A0ABQ3A5U8_9ACTN|nr:MULTISPECIES: hypothetical protein [Streptomyces]MYV93638.1 hypothetical protein [Streptomyces sp. SID1034]GGY37338.1 hypothetical protein GCM10010326_34120 [Streptomyces xanthochromogenes]